LYPVSPKDLVLNKCREYVDVRIATAKQAMDHAQQSANEEGKSSAGDKYETGRAMMQIERDRAAHQLQEAIQLKSVLDQIKSDIIPERISLGSLVVTDSKRIFISIGIGKLVVSDIEYFIVAPTSPLGKALSGLKVNDQLTFNKEVMTIREIL
jgi:transcription elongation GreA/GreB family factor